MIIKMIIENEHSIKILTILFPFGDRRQNPMVPKIAFIYCFHKRHLTLLVGLQTFIHCNSLITWLTYLKLKRKVANKLCATVLAYPNSRRDEIIRNF